MRHLLARTVRAVGICAVVGVTAAACGTSQASPPTTASTTTVVESTTTLVTIPPATTAPTTAPTFSVPTTAAPSIPPAPQASPEAAANALVGFWAAGNMTTALRVATSQAVATLFAVHYPSGLAVNRGCTSAFPPIICTYGAPGGGPVNAPIYQLYEAQAPGGWYVSSVEIH